MDRCCCELQVAAASVHHGSLLFERSLVRGFIANSINKVSHHRDIRFECKRLPVLKKGNGFSPGSARGANPCSIFSISRSQFTICCCQTAVPHSGGKLWARFPFVEPFWPISVSWTERSDASNTFIT